MRPQPRPIPITHVDPIHRMATMKKAIVWAIFALSLLGNLITLSVAGYGFLKYREFFPSARSSNPNGALSPLSSSGNAVVDDIIDIEKDGFKNSYIVATYDGQRVVIQNINKIFNIDKKENIPIKTGDSIKVMEIKVEVGNIKTIQHMLDPMK
jgi:hypothetical protein